MRQRRSADSTCPRRDVSWSPEPETDANKADSGSDAAAAAAASRDRGHLSTQESAASAQPSSAAPASPRAAPSPHKRAGTTAAASTRATSPSSPGRRAAAPSPPRRPRPRRRASASASVSPTRCSARAAWSRKWWPTWRGHSWPPIGRASGKWQAVAGHAQEAVPPEPRRATPNSPIGAAFDPTHRFTRCPSDPTQRNATQAPTASTRRCRWASSSRCPTPCRSTSPRASPCR